MGHPLASRAVLKSQLADAQGSLEETEARNKALQQECASLRRSVEAKLSHPSSDQYCSHFRAPRIRHDCWLPRAHYFPLALL